MSLETKLRAIVEAKIAGTDLFIVELKLSPTGRLIVSMDGDKGITIEQCSAISRNLGYEIEQQNLIETAYNLEVSSAGVDTPLKLNRQYIKNIGRNVRLKFEGDEAEKIEGKLVGVTDAELTLEVTKKEKGKKEYIETNQYAFTSIKECKVLVSFN